MINKIVTNDAFPMHRIEDQLEAIARSSNFSTLDLTKGYHQLKWAEGSKETTGFTTPR